jgi:5-hydroxyisourate hydrolase-like protein (transthyretin family)
MKRKWLLYPMVVMGALLIALLGMTPHANSSPMADVAEAGQPMADVAEAGQSQAGQGGQPQGGQPQGGQPQGFAPTGTDDVMLRGRVLPAQGKLFVELLSMDGRVLDVTRTDENGWYSFAPLPSGAYQLRVLDQDKQELLLAAGGQIAIRPDDREVEQTLSLALSATGDVMRQHERERAQDAALPAASEDASGGSEGYVNGQVTAAGTGEPLANVRVKAFYDNQDEPNLVEETARTDESGMYSMTLSTSRAYRIQFLPSSSGEYVDEWYNNKTNFDTADAIEVEEDVITTEINAELDVGGQILGRVTATDGDEPLQHVYVLAYDSITSTSSVASVRTNDTGVYALTSLAAGNYYLEFRGPSRSSYVTEYYDDQLTLATAEPVAVELEENVVGINAALDIGGTINGRVTATEGGAPLEDVNVYAYNSTSSSESDYVASGRADASGVYTVTTLPAGSYYLKFSTPYNSGYVDEYYNNKRTLATADAVTVELAETVGGIDASIETGGTINGTVTAVMGGTPIENASVYIYTDTMSISSIANGYTGADGTYEMIGLPAGNYYLKFQVPYNSAYVDEYYNDKLTLAEADPVAVELNTVHTVDAALETGGTINGTVTAVVGGAPLEDVPVTVEVYTDTTSTDSIKSAQTGADGTYEIIGLPAGNYYVCFRVPDYYYSNYIDECHENQATLATANAVAVALNTTETLDAALETAGTLSGVVTAEADGSPLSSVQIYVYDSDYQSISEYEYSPAAWTDSSGAYEISRLPAGNYYVKFEAPYDGNYVDEYYNNKLSLISADPVNVSANTVVPLDAALATGGTITGQVTAADTGLPLDDVRVSLYRDECDGSYFTELDYDYTDETGAYTFDGLPAGNYQLRFEPSSWGESRAYLDDSINPVSVTAGNSTTSDIALQRGGQIMGKVTAADSGAPLADVNVYAYYYNENYDRYYYHSSVRTNASGVYSTTGLISDTYRLSFEPSYRGVSAAYVEEFYNEQNSLATADEITVTPGQITNDIDAALALGGQIMGRITAEENGTPLESVSIDIYTSTLSTYPVAYAYTDENGVYTTTGLATGNYYVKFESPTWDTPAADYIDEYYNNHSTLGNADAIAVTAGSTTPNIDAELTRGGIITGKVTAEDSGLPLYDVYVVAYDSNGREVTYDFSESNGQYQLKGLPPGNYVVRFYGPFDQNGCDEIRYIGTYYNQKPDFASADPVSVSGTETVSNINAILSRDGDEPPPPPPPGDTTPPAMAMPDEMTIAATSPSGAVVNYQVTASDDTDPNPTVACVPAPGSLFPMGTTTVECTVTDASGNQSNGSFTITVIEAAYQIHLPLVVRP